MGLFGAAKRPPGLRVHLLVRGRIGEDWYDVDEVLELAPGATLKDLIDTAERKGLNLLRALDASPHLRHTMMVNGERCPVEQNQARPMADGDEVYLLAPLAGG